MADAWTVYLSATTASSDLFGQYYLDYEQRPLSRCRHFQMHTEMQRVHRLQPLLWLHESS